jgi:hypothetical protein
VDRVDRRGAGRQLPGTKPERNWLETLQVTLREALQLNRREALDAAGET